MGNALKFTEKGTVRVHLSTLSAAKDEDARIMFSISDTGIGIPDHKFKELFQPFTQVDGSYTRAHQGAGLGLVIVRRLVALLDGNITVESEVGQGTTVHMVLPFKLPTRDVSETTHAAPAPGEARKRLNILLAEDDPLNQLFMQSILKKLGHAVTLANNGQEAVELWKHNEFDCILMDIQMPVMTGDEATRRIRAAEVHRRVHGSRFSGSAVEEGEVHRGVHGSRCSGSAVEEGEVHREVHRGVHGSRCSGSAVEEGEVHRGVHRGVHGSRCSGSTVEKTADGGVGVGAKNLSPDGVTLHSTGSRATPAPTVNREPLNREPSKTVNCEPLNREPSKTVNREPLNREPRIPIIAVTAHTQPGDRERFLAAGMNDYLGKPVSVDNLERVLNKTMQHDDFSKRTMDDPEIMELVLSTYQKK